MKRFLDLPITKVEALCKKWDIFDYENTYVNEHNVPLRRTESGQMVGFTLLEEHFHNATQRKNLH